MYAASKKILEPRGRTEGTWNPKIHLPKNMEPKNEGAMVYESPFKSGDFQVPGVQVSGEPWCIW